MTRPHEQHHPDLYDVLGVEPNASTAHLDHAFRTLVRQHHPDTRDAASPADDQTLQRVLAAYAVLRDPAARADYDGRRTARTPVVVRRSPAPDPRQPPLRAGPVRWQPSPRR